MHLAIEEPALSEYKTFELVEILAFFGEKAWTVDSWTVQAKVNQLDSTKVEEIRHTHTY